MCSSATIEAIHLQLSLDAHTTVPNIAHDWLSIRDVHYATLIIPVA